MKILIVDDEFEIRENIRVALCFEGYIAAGAENGADALAHIQVDRPDLIFCDIVMPEMDGHKLLYALRQNSDTASIPFVFLSAHTSPDEVKIGLDEGASAYVKKPFTVDELLDVIDKLLGQHE